MAILRVHRIIQFYSWLRSVFAAVKKLLNKFTHGGNHRLCSVYTALIKVTIDKTSGNCVGHLPHKKLRIVITLLARREEQITLYKPHLSLFQFGVTLARLSYPPRHKGFSRELI